jgi:hypothetical protein
MMGMPSTSPEGQALAAETAFFSVLCIKQTLFGLKQAYQVRAQKSKLRNKLMNPFVKRSINGQVVVQIHPGDPASKINPFSKSNMVGEIWLDPKHVQDLSDVKPFNFDFFDKKKEGILVVLGAGNWSFLAVNDSLHGLFVLNQVVFLKHHILRGASLDPLIRKMFATLLQKGYFDSEVDKGMKRASEITYSPLVSTVHITGGKKAHDEIVWGHEAEEQAKRKAMNNPKLKAEMSAELGAVSPWIVPPVHYSNEELGHLARSIASGIFNNASCNCNAPKVLVMSKNWNQGRQLRDMIIEYYESFETSCSYYPGTEERWEAMKNNMNGIAVVESKRNLSVEERDLKAPLTGADHPVTLPLLICDIEVDLMTNEGREDAKTQYAFRNESFAPTFCFARIADDGTIDGFLQQSVTLANDYLFGTLSCSLTVPPLLESTDAIEMAIANLQYGNITLNAWAAVGFVSGLPWGGFPRKEKRLDDVQTGSAKIFNPYFLPYVEKAVVRTPMVAENHIIKPTEFPSPEGNLNQLKYFVSASVDPATEVGYINTLNRKVEKKIEKLEAQIAFFERNGDDEQVKKIRDQIIHVKEKAFAEMHV